VTVDLTPFRALLATVMHC